MQPYATQTPGVYLNELNAFPNSIVEVATAIPAFIGYTQTASYKGKDLSNKPVRVESLQDFQTFFGAGFPQQFSLTAVAPPPATGGGNAAGGSAGASTTAAIATPGAVKLRFGANGLQYLLQPTQAQTSLYYLYSAICLFYLNGGSTCYIVSIGTYDGSPAQKSDFEAAMAKLEFEQDPTMLLCPDALRLGKNEYNEVMQQMLAHCGKVQSRVALFDLYDGAMTDPLLLDTSTPIQDFRDAVQDNLHYGIAYFPWVKTTVTSTTDISFLNLDADSLTVLKDALNPPPLTYADLQNAAKNTASDAQNAQTKMNAAISKAAADVADATGTPTATTDITQAQDTLVKVSASDAAALQKAQSDLASAITKDVTTANTAIAQAQTALTNTSASDAGALQKAQSDLANAIATGLAHAEAAIAAAQAALANVPSDATTLHSLQQALDDAVTLGVAAAKAATTVQETAQESAALALQATVTYNDLSKQAANAQAVLTTATNLVLPLLTKADVAAATAKMAAQQVGTPAVAEVKDNTGAIKTPAQAATGLLGKATATGADDTARRALAAAEQQALTLTAVAEAAYNAVDIAIGKAAGSKTIKVSGLPAVAGVTPLPVNIFDLAITLQSSQVPSLSDPAALKAKRLSVQNALGTAFPDYARTIQAITDFVNTLPVAPAMAGVYTAVDNNRGVWKAPANVGLNAVTMPTLGLNDELQADLNVDAATGKSINAIRYFNGMGTQVWGARTLDGNSDDWRYVNVRRTLIMIEQSVKLATRTYVFEPNNANTWVTVQSMINSFLLNLWKQGALFGTVPTEAYSVSVGVGTTMTTDDVLQGIMRVLVRVSLVRPAEFILLTFEQEMPGA